MRICLSIIIVLFIFGTASYGQDSTWCGLPDSLASEGTTSNLTLADTVDGVVLFAIFPEDTTYAPLETDTLWTVFREFGDTSGYGPGQILKKSSFGKHILNLDINPQFNDKYIILPHSQVWYDSVYGHDDRYFDYLGYMLKYLRPY